MSDDDTDILEWSERQGGLLRRLAAVAGMIADETPSVRKIVSSTLAAHGEEPHLGIAA